MFYIEKKNTCIDFIILFTINKIKYQFTSSKHFEMNSYMIYQYN